jgi:hypothetical protein
MGLPEIRPEWLGVNLRGIICSVEREGSITIGDICTIILHKRVII